MTVQRTPNKWQDMRRQREAEESEREGMVRAEEVRTESEEEELQLAEEALRDSEASAVDALSAGLTRQRLLLADMEDSVGEPSAAIQKLLEMFSNQERLMQQDLERRQEALKLREDIAQLRKEEKVPLTAKSQQ